MLRLRNLLPAVALTLLVALLSLSPAPAHAIGTTRGCHSYNYASQHNDWNFFWNHRIRVYERVCIRMGSTRYQNYPYLRWIRRPVVSLSSRGRPSTETVRVTRSPHLVGVSYLHGRKHRVRYAFSLRSCSIYLICQDWEFTFRVGTLATKICVENGHGRCDRAKWW